MEKHTAEFQSRKWAISFRINVMNKIGIPIQRRSNGRKVWIECHPDFDPERKDYFFRMAKGAGGFVRWVEGGPDEYKTEQ